jgi:hypothetical protein
MTSTQFCLIILNIWLVGLNVSKERTDTLSIIAFLWFIISIISLVI